MKIGMFIVLHVFATAVFFCVLESEWPMAVLFSLIIFIWLGASVCEELRELREKSKWCTHSAKRSRLIALLKSNL